MSRIGRNPIEIPEGVDVAINQNLITVKGKLGELSQSFHPDMSMEQEDGKLTVKRPTDEKKHRELHGLTRALIANMISGVSKGYSKKLKLVGVGYTADAKNGKFLILNIGFSHSIYLEIPDEIKIETPDNTTVIVSGINKQIVGQVAAKVRSFRPPEPYKGKGIRYEKEYVRRKAGKTIGA